MPHLETSFRVEIREASGDIALQPFQDGRYAVVGGAFMPGPAAAANQVPQDEQAKTQRKPATREASRARCSSGAAAGIALRAVASTENEGVRKRSLSPSEVNAKMNEEHHSEST